MLSALRPLFTNNKRGACTISRAMLELSHPGSADIDDLDTAIEAGRASFSDRPLFAVTYRTSTATGWTVRPFFRRPLMRGDARVSAWFSSIAAADRVVVCTHHERPDLVWPERLAAGRCRAKLEEKATRLFAALPYEPITRAAGDRCASVKISQQR